MRAILTHELADFDAIASVLAVYLLDGNATPVLPRRTNRNVRAFLTLYGMELPFVEPDDLPSQPVEAVTLVDTQSMVSLKGMDAHAQIQVIDHHPRRENLAGDWSVETPETGATVTYLVELLREQNYDLTQIQATLLMLGIYEDTGSLTYTQTTPRDLQAAAFLLSSGANLQIAVKFLNHPLTQAQQDLYDRLRAEAETHQIHGHTVIITSGNAQKIEEELSTIAHKLRDLLDPDALFVLIKIRGGIQMIARSTSDHIDVAAIVSHFGGGGHERAAAGLIRDQSLEAVRTELIRILPTIIRPAISVAQIMSRRPQLLTLDTPLEEADQRMRRYGYEGYPVVAIEKSSAGNKHRIVGLLTRRGVDRTLAHKLILPIASVMQKGEVTIYPDDSIETLQRLMIETGWGQIPVIDRQTAEIIGIVTRTDMIKTLAPQALKPEQQIMVSRLETALPADLLELLKVISQTAQEQHTALYIVGGFVRDLLLDIPSLDFDLVVEGDAILLAKNLAGRWGGRVTSHHRFGTAKWHLTESSFSSNLRNKNHESIDLITARTEFYSYPTALPVVERGSIKLDLHRRDFTINTLALRLDGRHYGELHDHWGGLTDLRRGFVRVLHSLSFVDDPTRILRAVRFEQRLGFRIEDRTLELLNEAHQMIEHLSGDRIRHEFDHILADSNVAKILGRLHQLNLLQVVHPALTWDDWLTKQFYDLPTDLPEANWELDLYPARLLLRRDLGYILWTIRLEPGIAQAIGSRLKMSSQLSEKIGEACYLWKKLPELIGSRPSQVTAELESISPVARYACWLFLDQPDLKELITDYVNKWRFVRPNVNGNDLRDCHVPAGPIYKTILGQLRSARLDGEIHSTEEEQLMLESLVNSARALEAGP
jgi:tRNA nucleotidyltransferase (CCA-adding enzyme)